MAVDLAGREDRLVAELVLDGFEGLAVADEPARVGVAQVVDPRRRLEARGDAGRLPRGVGAHLDPDHDLDAPGKGRRADHRRAPHHRVGKRGAIQR